MKHEEMNTLLDNLRGMASPTAEVAADEIERLRERVGTLEATLVAAKERERQTRALYARTIPWLVKILDLFPGTGWNAHAREIVSDILAEMRAEVALEVTK